MNFKGHLITGTIMWALLTVTLFALDYMVPITTWVMLFGVIVYFALAPDVDTKSVINKWTGGILSVIGLISLYMGYTVIVYAILIYFGFISITKHRGFTHTWLFAGLISGGIYIIFSSLLISIAVLLGFAAHFIADKQPFRFW